MAGVGEIALAEEQKDAEGCFRERERKGRVMARLSRSWEFRFYS